MTDKRTFNAKIITPYLYENMREECTEEYVQKQIEYFEYDPNNLGGIKFLETNRFIVNLNTRTNCSKANPDLIIIGSAGVSEDEVEMLKPSGILVARYSIFYGGPSSYTGNTPEEGGYSLDLPKSVATSKALLTHDGVLESILEREESKIRDAVENLNKTIEKPVLITPFLAKALKARE